MNEYSDVQAEDSPFSDMQTGARVCTARCTSRRRVREPPVAPRLPKPAVADTVFDPPGH